MGGAGKGPREGLGKRRRKTPPNMDYAQYPATRGVENKVGKVATKHRGPKA